ncbi:MAG: ABC transporter permease [Proteobacteria bacterium]|nr:ABC transporter permease [Pseudomonadota bacterium]MCP4918951.1 ABC transporter permease [Pseudomonadota bacterium]
MFSYALRKLLLAIPLVIGVITLIFFLVELSPGDATDRFFTPETPPEVRQLIEAKWGLDKPAHERYFITVKNLLTGDFGRSIFQERPVFDIIMESLPNTIQLALMSIIIMQVVGITLGTIQAVRQYGWADSGVSIVSLFFYSMPSFWLALMLQLILTLKYPVLPSSGMTDAVMYDYMTTGEQILDRMKHLILPGVALSIARAAGIARYMRSSLLEVIRQDYIRTARAKGLPEWKVIIKHGMRNALLPIVTIIGLQLPFLFSGSVLVETIFAWPGMGRLIVSAIFTQDTPVIIGCFFVFTLLVVTGNLIADLLYSVVDPRIRYS